MNYFRMLFLLGALIFLSFKSDEDEITTEIVWSGDRPLTWTDFEAPVDATLPYDAWTWFGISYVYSWYYSDDRIRPDLNAYAYFDKSKSWVKKNKMSADLLAHEQIHFDIAELYCREFIRRVYSADYTTNIESEIDSIYNVVYSEMMATQANYDEETNHFKNKEAQKKWNLRIDSLLRSHD